MQIVKAGGFLNCQPVSFCLPGTIRYLRPATTLSPTLTHRTARSWQEKLRFCFCLGGYVSKMG